MKLIAFRSCEQFLSRFDLTSYICKVEPFQILHTRYTYTNPQSRVTILHNLTCVSFFVSLLIINRKNPMPRLKDQEPPQFNLNWDPQTNQISIEFPTPPPPDLQPEDIMDLVVHQMLLDLVEEPGPTIPTQQAQAALSKLKAIKNNHTLIHNDTPIPLNDIDHADIERAFQIATHGEGAGKSHISRFNHPQYDEGPRQNGHSRKKRGSRTATRAYIGNPATRPIHFGRDFNPVTGKLTPAQWDSRPE